MFKLNGTDFRIDMKKSRFKVRTSKVGIVTIDADIYGDKARYEKITENEASPWSWTLYPPHFYMHSFPGMVGRVAGRFRAKVSVDDLDEHEVAIYLMEHNDVDDVTVSIDGQTFKARGMVFLSGRAHPFSITFTKPKA